MMKKLKGVEISQKFKRKYIRLIQAIACMEIFQLLLDKRINVSLNRMMKKM